MSETFGALPHQALFCSRDEKVTPLPPSRRLSEYMSIHVWHKVFGIDDSAALEAILSRISAADKIRTDLVDGRPGMYFELQREHGCAMWLVSNGARVGFYSVWQASLQQIAAISQHSLSIRRWTPEVFENVVTQVLNSQIGIQGDPDLAASSKVIASAWKSQVKRTPSMRWVCAVGA